MSVALYAEDAFGPQFFRKLIPVLREQGLVPPETTLVDASKYPVCNPKLGRIIAAARERTSRIIVVVDADGGNVTTAGLRTLGHVVPVDRDVTRVIVIDYEIEEWICVSMGYKTFGRKPSEVLREKLGYEKYRLPEYVAKLDFARLGRESASFARFLAAFN